ncbi:MAG: translation elongation factor Ts [Parcubacteria group bacterium RIFCSPLOWO2_01_FULL_40_65]|nr:MAG: translation elongation factor Ts [Parcubacteria group bacterium RIFCSPHIGHO2_01_FULL_40_30]OHB19303.1 MAG: translation elongation factor Ts [Parcubacteria group bacterium RIFCSPHIGHO2_02_FULL_40_12]OHB21054.1 MAG: translation elongation factor Ts [Parcubacteria group bacterium RIFCSPLOWO2_01_FULL_40_65]OHB23355.1 MAG: translation elongation factor Ts [Parcubacteria group bacterium RIFCSPLOWO2_02_FULL_40_12]OHB24502.1 MAG: translation elongation factor Ts [Parcubacteria group bacterium R
MIDSIKKIREQTGLSVADIKNALKEAGGDETKALEVLSSRGHKIAEKKAGREAKEGIIESYIHGTKKVGAIIVLNCETDFVAKSQDFQELAHDLAMQIASMDPKDIDELMKQPFIKEQELAIKELISKYIAKLGENIKIGDFKRYQM